MENKMVLGIGIFFRTEEEYTMMCESEVILVEGSIALDKFTNTFAVSSKIKKQDSIWEIIFANTYQMNKADDIRNKMH